MKLNIICILIVICCCANVALTQDTLLVNKKGIPILPAKGDWALGIDARPFTNIFNNESNVGFNFIRDNALIGKKFIDDNLAHRAKLRIGFYSNSDDRYIMEDGQIIPEPSITVTDTRTINSTNVSIGYGLERRSGYGRVQAVYGAELSFLYHAYSESFKYGNPYSMENPDPSTTNFGSNIPAEGKRVTYMEDGSAFGVALQAFIGVEFFIAAKMSIGGEFGWGISYVNEGEGNTKISSWNAEDNTVRDEIYKTGGENYFDIDNTNFGGAIFFMFYFN
ncbi:MAG: hypothetical protein R2750_05720 [Bacteroidales bacterium]